jgi:hypothetical protein
MKKLIFLLLLWLYPITGFSAIDEWKTDVYFANGILTKEEDARANALDVLYPAIEEDIYGTEVEMKKHIGRVWYAYNRTIGEVEDLVESGAQIFEISELLDKLVQSLNEDKTTIHALDLDDQVNQYKASIEQGHKVLVVAHSQGNLFTYEAYRRLGTNSTNGWMQKYFEAVSIASPDFTDVIKEGTPEIGWDNDIVAWMGRGFTDGGADDCDVRQVKWWLRPYLIGDTPTPKPTDNYVYQSQVDTYHNGWWKALNSWRENLDSNVHAFTFYMGLPIKEGDENKSNYEHVYINPFSGEKLEKLKDDTARTKIMIAIKTKLDALEKVFSQWKPKDINCGSKICEDTRIRVTHIHDAKSMDKYMKDIPVYPFDTENGKIYKIGEKYVMASCGGETVVENPEDGVCYKIEETEETIEGKDANSSTEPFIIHQGVVETTLGWNYGLDIDMDLEMTGPNVHKDVEDIPDVGLEHAYVKSAYDLKPGDLLELYATGEKKADSELEESCLDTEPVKIYAIVKTPAGSKFKQYEAQNFAELNLGKYAEIEVAQKITPKWVCPALSNTPNWHNLYNQVTNNFQCIYCPSPYDVVWNSTSKSYYCNVPRTSYNYTGGGSGGGGGTRTYDRCSEEEKTKSCGCVPCEYIVRGMENSVEYGPIAGASVKIVDAQNYGKDNPVER